MTEKQQFFTDVVKDNSKEETIKTVREVLNSETQGGTTGSGNLLQSDSSGVWLQGYTMATSPLVIYPDGSIKIDQATIKKILLETITTPAAADGKIWAESLSGNKLPFLYAGGQAGKQQISAGLMQKHTQINYSSDQTITINTFFKPRLVFFHGSFVKSGDNIYGTTNGMADYNDNPLGVCNTFYVRYTSTSNVVSGLTPSTGNAVETIDFVTPTYTTDTYIKSETHTNNTLKTILDIEASLGVDCIAADAGAKTLSLTPNTWGDLSLTLDLVCPTGWQILGNITVVG